MGSWQLQVTAFGSIAKIIWSFGVHPLDPGCECFHALQGSPRLCCFSWAVGQHAACFCEGFQLSATIRNVSAALLAPGSQVTESGTLVQQRCGEEAVVGRSQKL
eukprot:17686-Karenia_brevis.AAC.1